MRKNIQIEKTIAKLAFKKKKRYKHTKRVVKLCKYFARVLNIKHKDILIKAAWLHDIGRLVDKNNHNRPTIIRPLLTHSDYKDKHINDILDIIENHKDDFKPTNFLLEAAILRICDKLDKYHKLSKKEARSICNKNLNTILDYLAEKVNPVDILLFKITCINLIK